MKFSQRIGITPVETALQTDGMTPELRNTLWNILDLHVWSSVGFMRSNSGHPKIMSLGKVLWFAYFKMPIDNMPNNPHATLAYIRKQFFGCLWYQVYDMLEFLFSALKTLVSERINNELVSNLNTVLEKELSGFRVINLKFVQVTDEVELESLRYALSESPFKGVEVHMKSAREHLSRRGNPDYRNSIKESISAVESIAKEITDNPKATLGAALSKLERDQKLHPALKQGFSNIYGYTNDEGGIRHAMLEEPNLTASDAKFFLVSCASFINYLKSKVIQGTNVD